MRHAYLAIAGLAVLSACATPREQCEARVERDLKALKQAIAASEANLQRGYGLKTEIRPRTRFGLCVGDTDLTTCLKTEYDTKEVPVAIDLEQERRALASAKRRLAQEEERRAAALAQCAAQYPDS